MLKKEIKYTDYDGNERVEDFYFNLSKAELIEMQFEEAGGYLALLERCVQAQDGPTIMKEFKKLIMKSYGIKSADGKTFIKTLDGRPVAEDFVQSEAYSELIMEFFKDSKKAADFFNAVIPEVKPGELSDKAGDKQATEPALKPAT